MLNTKLLFGLAMLVPLLGAAIPAEAAKKVDATAARAACFKQANAAAAATGGASSSAASQSEGNRLVTTPMRRAAGKRVSVRNTRRVWSPKTAFGRSFVLCVAWASRHSFCSSMSLPGHISDKA